MKFSLNRIVNATLSAFAIAFAAQSYADIKYWNPTSTPRAYGNGVWSTVANAWADDYNGTDAPVVWVDGADADFNYHYYTSGDNEITVDGVSVGSMNFNGQWWGNNYWFKRGTGALSLSGDINNYGAWITFDNDIELTADSFWNVNGDGWMGNHTTVNGALSGNHTLTKYGAKPLILSNANHSVSGIALNGGALHAYGGGSLTAPDGTLTVGASEQTHNAELIFHPLADREETEWSVGTLTAGGYGEVLFNTATPNTNVIEFAGLGREPGGVLLFKQSDGNFGAPQRIGFADESAIAANGMLPPWVYSSQNFCEFLMYDDGGVGIADYTAGAVAENWTGEDIIENTYHQTLETDTAVHALKLWSSLTIPEGVTLTNNSGGLILYDQLYGDGVLDCGDNDLVVYIGGWWDCVIQPRIKAKGLTVVIPSGRTLTLTNITTVGDINIRRGFLTLDADDDIVFTNNISGGIFSDGNYGGILTKTGAGSFTFDGSDSSFGKFSWAGGETLTVKDSSVAMRHTSPNWAGGFTFPNDGTTLLVTNSFFSFAGQPLRTNGKNNTTTRIVESTVDCNLMGMIIGDNGSGNTLIVDGGGVTGAAFVNSQAGEGNPFSVGIGAGASNNVMSIINGGEVLDYYPHKKGGNTIGTGNGAVNNRVEVIGGGGYVSTFTKGIADTVGRGAGAANNMILVDGRGVTGSAVFNAYDELTIGYDGGNGNRLIVRDGGQVFRPVLTVGNNASDNLVEITGEGALVDGNNGNSLLSVGIGNATNNIIYVADGGELRGFGNYQAAIGGSGGGAGAGSIVGNRLIIGPNGYANIDNELNIGRTRDIGSVAHDNQVLVSGADAKLNTRIDRTIIIGTANDGAVAYDNELVVEDGAVVTSGAIAVGNMNADPLGESFNNRLIVRNNGAVYVNTGTPYSRGFHVGEIGRASCRERV